MLPHRITDGVLVKVAEQLPPGRNNNAGQEVPGKDPGLEKVPQRVLSLSPPPVAVEPALLAGWLFLRDALCELGCFHGFLLDIHAFARTNLNHFFPFTLDTSYLFPANKKKIPPPFPVEGFGENTPTTLFTP